jgi:AcrR family transcriptional regulator
MKSPKDLLDLRVRRTYKFLWDALMSLMADRDFESITVTDICERAMVHRTTFYKHYEDKYGLLYHGIQDELSSLFEAVDTAANKATDLEEKDIVRIRHITLLEHVLKHEGFYRLMLTGNGFERFSVLLRKSLVEHFEQHFRQAGEPVPMPIALHIQLQAAGIVAMITWWLENDCPYTPIEMIRHVSEHINLVG